MEFITKNCLNCGTQFNAPAQEVKRGNGKFCNLKCSAQFTGRARPKPELNAICALCRQEFHLAKNKKRSKSGLYFCCRAHKDAAQCIGGIREIMPPHYGETVADYRTKVFKVEGKPKVCERCGFDKEAAIIVHHKDRNRDNNDISNLEILCANCHAIEHLSGH